MLVIPPPNQPMEKYHMTKTMSGSVVFGEFEAFDTFEWTDPATGTVKVLRSLKVLFSNGDKTVSRLTLSLSPTASFPKVIAEQQYGFPVKIKFNKKRERIDYELRTDIPPFPAPEIQ